MISNSLLVIPASSRQAETHTHRHWSICKFLIPPLTGISLLSLTGPGPVLVGSQLVARVRKQGHRDASQSVSSSH